MKRNHLYITALAAVTLAAVLNITSYADTVTETEPAITSSGVKRYVSQGRTNYIIDDTQSTDEKEDTQNVSEENSTVAQEVTVESAPEASPEEENAQIRMKVANLAESYAGAGVYRYGGNNPATGVDCSGFSRFVIQNAAGLTLNRSSRAQVNQGSPVASIDQARPGDLIFYAKGGYVNHVAVYLGNGRVVSASSRETGIRITPWNYRPAVAIRNVLG